jgi:hypothetical protein
MSNYGGSRQSDYIQNIKQFQDNQSNNSNTWTFNSNAQLTPLDQTKNVLITKNLYVNGSVVSPSDISLKDNIRTLDNTDIDMVLNVEPIQYTLIADTSKKAHYGFIAQDLEKYYPELIYNTCSDNDANVKNVNYIELIPILLGKMKQMQSEIDKLKEVHSKKI